MSLSLSRYARITAYKKKTTKKKEHHRFPLNVSSSLTPPFARGPDTSDASRATIISHAQGPNDTLSRFAGGERIEREKKEKRGRGKGTQELSKCQY